MIHTLRPGSAETSLDQVSTAIDGKVFAVSQPSTRHGGGPREVTWSYEPGSTKPDAIVVELKGCLELTAAEAPVNPVILDTYNTVATPTLRTASIGKMRFLYLDISSITIGGGDPVDGKITI
jgi:hypothetical protein